MPDSINDLEIYREAMDMGEVVWEMVVEWGYFAKDTVGKQLVRATDSIASNLSEGFGRYHYRDKKNFYYYSRASAGEAQTWVEKATRRSLIDPESARELYKRLDTLKKRINAYIRTVGSGTTPSQTKD